VVKKGLKRAWHALQHAPDRAFHRLRRSHATRVLRGHVPKSVVFVCHGNICRSPFAAAVFQRLAAQSLPVRVPASSVGFIGPGRGAPANALAAAERRGLDLSRHRSRLVTPKAIRAAGLVVVMAAEQARTIRRLADLRADVIVLGDLDPEPISARTVIDPWGGSDDVFDQSYDRIERCVGELVRLIGDATPVPRPSDGSTTRASSVDSGVRAARDTSRQELPR
jgi:protein-tyrosine-phosphatase